MSVQRYTKVRADDGGNFIGVESAVHCHIDVGNPHFKVGTDDNSRINFGRDMSLARMQRAYEAMLANYEGSPGFEDCKEYFEEQGCAEPEQRPLVDILKDMLLKWGGLSDHEITFYTDDTGDREETPVHDPSMLDDTILDVEAEIRKSNEIYDDFLEEGAFLSPANRDLDIDEMHEEATEMYGSDNRKAKSK